MSCLFSTQVTKTLIAAVVLIALSISAQTVSADQYNHINRMAVKIRNQTRSLLRETEHYRYTPNYRHLVGDAAALRQLAEQVREIARNEGCLDALASYVAKMDHTFAHLEALFDDTELLAAHSHGAVKGHTAHVKRLLKSIDECICYMRDDIEVLRSSVVVPSPVVARRPVITQVETYSVPGRQARSTSSIYGGRGLGYGDGPKYGHRPKAGYGNGGYSLYLGGGSSRIHFNF